MELPVLKTERLLLRKYRKADSESCFVHYGQDLSLGEFLPMFPVSSVEEMGKLIEGYIEAYESNAYIWVIEICGTKECIGNISVDIRYPALNTGEIAFCLGEQYQKQGFAREAVDAVLKYMFEQNLHLVEANCNERNIRSRKLLESTGFRMDGILRDRRINQYTGKYDDLAVYSILADEYEHKLQFPGI